jgi:hypothetical protein
MYGLQLSRIQFFKEATLSETASCSDSAIQTTGVWVVSEAVVFFFMHGIGLAAA